MESLPALIGPSLLASDLSNLASESNRVIAAGADFLHLDVMDGHFVPNITFGAPVISCLRKQTMATFDVHLMVSQPEKWINDMKSAGANIFTFHVESSIYFALSTEPSSDLIEDVSRIISLVKAAGMQCGLSIKPQTPVEYLIPFISMIDLALIMTVEPGFGGQNFMVDMMPKLSTLRTLSPTLTLEVDGGLDLNTVSQAAAAGANMIVAGTSVFRGDPTLVIASMRRSVESKGITEKA